jgi:hypothetical protein
VGHLRTHAAQQTPDPWFRPIAATADSLPTSSATPIPITGQAPTKMLVSPVIDPLIGAPTPLHLLVRHLPDFARHRRIAIRGAKIHDEHRWAAEVYVDGPAEAIGHKDH